jgi:hypothetical protein
LPPNNLPITGILANGFVLFWACPPPAVLLAAEPAALDAFCPAELAPADVLLAAEPAALDAFCPAELAPADVLLAAEPAALDAFCPAELAPADVLLAAEPDEPPDAELVVFFWLVVVPSAASPFKPGLLPRGAFDDII